MGTIYETINILKRASPKKEEWLKSQTYHISAKDLGKPEPAQIHYSDGTLMELCSLESIEEGVCWISANVSFEDKGGKLKHETIKIEILDDEMTDTNLNPVIVYPSEVFAASGKLVYLMA